MLPWQRPLSTKCFRNERFYMGNQCSESLKQNHKNKLSFLLKRMLDSEKKYSGEPPQLNVELIKTTAAPYILG